MKVGDRVYCIDNEGRANLSKGSIYTVTFIYYVTECVELYDFVGLAFAMERFITVKELRKLKLEKINGKI